MGPPGTRQGRRTAGRSRVPTKGRPRPRTPPASWADLTRIPASGASTQPSTRGTCGLIAQLGGQWSGIDVGGPAESRGEHGHNDVDHGLVVVCDHDGGVMQAVGDEPNDSPVARAGHGRLQGFEESEASPEREHCPLRRRRLPVLPVKQPSRSRPAAVVQVGRRRDVVPAVRGRCRGRLPGVDRLCERRVKALARRLRPAGLGGLGG